MTIGRRLSLSAILIALMFLLPASASAAPNPPGELDGPSYVPLGSNATFTWGASPGGGVDHYACTLTKFVGKPTETTVLTDPCTSPQTLTGLPEGQHSLQVRAVDAAGDQSDPSGVGFLVDTGVSPAGSDFIFNGPADNSIRTGPVTGFNGTIDTNTTGFPDYERRYIPGIVVQMWRVSPGGTLTDQLTFVEHMFRNTCFFCEDFDWTDETPLTAHYVVNKIGSLPSADGQYLINAVQYGRAKGGNPPHLRDVRNFTIDSRAPDTTIDSTPGPGTSSSPTFTFSGTDPDPTDGRGSGIASYECSLDGGTWQACTSGNPIPQSAAEGERTLRVRAIDRAGNKDNTPASATFIVDLTPPVITITRPAAKDRYLLHEGPNPVFTCVDPPAGSPPAASGIATCTATPINDEDLGPHFFQVNSTDNAGNASSKKTVYTIDPPDYGDFIGRSDPITYYRLNESLGSPDMLDSSGNNHHGTYQNGIALGRGGATVCERRPHPPRVCELAHPAENKAGYFPARDGHGYVNGITAPTTGYTMEAWVRPRDGSDMMVVSHGGGGQLFIKDGRLAFRQVQDTIYSTGTVNPGIWTHVAATWNGSVTRLYVNGAQVASSSSANKAPSGTSTFYVGYGEMAPWFHGDLDEVAYYDRALSAHAFVDRHKIGVARDNPSLERGNSEFNTEGPSTDPVAPRNNGLYAPGKTPSASFTCSDPDDLPGDSDVATCTATVDGNPIADGAPLPDSIGTHVFVVTAIDKGGNEYVHPHTYMVKTFSQIYGHDLPLAYYRLGDGSGQPMVDASSNGHNGEYKNDQDSGPTGIAGDGDKARDFFGAGGYGFVNGIAAPRFQSTLEAWVKPFDGRNQSILGHGDAGEIYVRDGSFHFRHMGSTVTSSMPARPGEWQQVVGTWDGVEIRIFVDGIEAGKTEATKRPSSISTFYVGFGELAPWFRGAIDEVAYYGVALPATRVYQHWLADPPPDDTAASTPEVPVPGEVTKPSEPSERPTPVTVPRDDPASPDGPTTDTVEDKPGVKSEARSRKHRAKVKKCRTIKKKARRKDCLKRLR